MFLLPHLHTPPPRSSNVPQEEGMSMQLAVKLVVVVSVLAGVYSGVAQAQTTVDSISGSGTVQYDFGVYETFTVNGTSFLPQGGAATGTFTYTQGAAGGVQRTETGVVTCVRVSGNVATVSARVPMNLNFSNSEYRHFTVEDNTASGEPDRISGYYVGGGSNTCASSTFPLAQTITVGDFVVFDGQADECPNIAGDQATVPPGMVKDANGDCVLAAPTTVTVTPTAKTNTVGEQHCVTATASNAAGPSSGYDVYFTVTGTTTGRDTSTGSATTNSSGQAQFCYTAQFPGIDTITAVVDADDDGTPEATEPTGTATKTYVLPVSTPLCQVSITDGGWIVTASGDRASFGGVAKVTKDGQTQGEQVYQDHGPAATFTVKSTQVLALTCSGNEATIYGSATIASNVPVLFRIRVKDTAKSGKGDMYGILLSNGYTSGDQLLRGGNITILRK
jgi:hypothetical protein